MMKQNESSPALANVATADLGNLAVVMAAILADHSAEAVVRHVASCARTLADVVTDPMLATDLGLRAARLDTQAAMLTLTEAEVDGCPDCAGGMTLADAAAVLADLVEVQS